jgi:integrase
MANYPGRRKGTRRIVIWSKNRSHEWVVRGSKADGDAFEARKRLELNAAKLTVRAAPTFSEFAKHQYVPFAQTNLKRSTWLKTRIYQLATLRDFFGPMRLTEISAEEIERYKRTRTPSVRPHTVNNELRVLRTVLNYAADMGYPSGKPKIVKLKPRGEGRVRTWTAAQLEALFVEARKESETLMRILVFLANTGCRKGEAIAAEWDWIDFDAEMIRIPSNELWQPKNGKPREIPMSDSCRAILSGPRKHERWVFPKSAASRYTEFPKDAFWAARGRAKLQGGPHTLRHTFASIFLKNQPDLFLLSKVLGHSHQRVTEIYAHLLPDHLARARNAVNIGPPMKTMDPPMAATAATDKHPKKMGSRH